MKKAKHIKDIKGMKSDAALYKLEQEETYGWDDEYKTKFVIVSAVTLPFPHIGGGTETYIFPATEDGEIIQYLEMEGSRRGTLKHCDALIGLGYEIVYDK
jgi:hypothetical protein